MSACTFSFDISENMTEYDYISLCIEILAHFQAKLFDLIGLFTILYFILLYYLV